MIGGAAQADFAVLVVDATPGEFETGFGTHGQTKVTHPPPLHCLVLTRTYHTGARSVGTLAGRHAVDCGGQQNGCG